MVETQKHMSLAELVMFQDPALEQKTREPLANHIKECAICREKVISLLTLKSAFSSAREVITSMELTGDCVPTEVMGDFLGGRLPEQEWQAYSRHTDMCDTCFERIAYFSYSSVKMTEGVLRMEPTPQKFLQAVAPGLIQSAPKTDIRPIREAIKDRVARWIASPIPAYAFAATLLLFLAFGGKGPQAVDLGSHQTFTIYEPPTSPGPSFGFSDAGRKVGQAQADMKVNVRRGVVSFSWQGVEGAQNYRLVIKEIDPSGSKEVLNLDTVQPGATVDLDTLRQGRAYRWSVHGVQPDNNIFTATGQFAIAKP
ncbi:MAG: hypothetical protein OEZ55_02435 [Nitrospinota bacterium]|nr:hypothetical protein [Nitrospinota bacterium]MDH5755511.1 hypothetical protein [Nitrospinota bacterium]